MGNRATEARSSRRRQDGGKEPFPAAIYSHLKERNWSNSGLNPGGSASHIGEDERFEFAAPAELIRPSYANEADLFQGDEVSTRLSDCQAGLRLNRVHTGIYLGEGLVVSKYPVLAGQDGPGKIVIEEVRCWRNPKLNRRGHQVAARRALEKLRGFQQNAQECHYHMHTNNCQHFTQECLMMSY